MAYTPIAPGTPDWDVPVNAAFTSQDGRITTNTTNIASNTSNIASNTSSIQAINNYLPELPTDHGLIGWVGNPNMFPNQSALSAGVLAMVKVKVPVATTVTNSLIAINTLGSGLTSGQNLVGLYNSSGTLLATSADQTTPWASTGLKTAAFTVPPSVSAGDYYVGLLSNGATPPQLFRGVGSAAASAFLSIGQTATNANWTSSGSAQTALPASVAMGSRTLLGTGFWAALS